MFFLEFVFPFIVEKIFLLKNSNFVLITFCKKKTSLSYVLFKNHLLLKLILKVCKIILLESCFEQKM